LDRPKALQDRVFVKLFEQAEIAKYSEAERRQYEESKKDYWDYYSTMKTARQKGIEEGMEMGMEKARRENARKMKSDGMPAALIEKYTGLSADDINRL
ncbi:MAG: hypothetical protein IJ928_06160, partial [Prevotella sp.]|nr:hypothetical protein [Prevotella sp.]